MGSGVAKRKRALAVRCARMAELGYTHRDIAIAVGKRPEQIKALVLLGQRVRDLQTASDKGQGRG